MPGRKRTPQDFVLGIDFGGTKIDVGTADLGGEALLSGRLETEANSGAAQAVDRALGLARGLVERSAEGGGRCLAAGVVSPGIVREDAVLLAPNVPGWGELRLPERVGAALDGVPVAAGNDVNAAALAESRWGALHAADPGLFISLGTGIKAAIVIGGRVFTGANGAAGEIGYSLRHAEGANGFANGRAPLEEFVGGRAIGERAGCFPMPLLTFAGVAGDTQGRRHLAPILQRYAGCGAAPPPSAPRAEHDERGARQRHRHQRQRQRRAATADHDPRPRRARVV